RRLRNRAAVDVVSHAQDAEMRRSYLRDRLLNDALDSAKAAHTHDLAQGPIHHLRDITRRLKCAALVCLDDCVLDLAPRLSFQAGDQSRDLTPDLAHLLEFLLGPKRILVNPALKAAGDAL